MQIDDDFNEGEFIDWLLSSPVLNAIRERTNHGADAADGGDQTAIAANQDMMNPLPDNLEHARLIDEELDLLLTDELSSVDPDLRASVNVFPHSGVRLVYSGEIRTVQDRFHAILKRRLQAEIQQNPPLFPWETEITDYDYETTEVLAPMTPQSSWMAQLRNWNVPEPVMAKLLEQCRQVVQLSLLEGARLVKAVESLFPAHDQELNSIAGHFVLGASRLPSDVVLSQDELPVSFEAASPRQQMVVSMLAAKKIMDALTVTVTADQPTVERQWLTDAGMISLVTRYDSQGEGSIRISGMMPCGASLILKSGAAETQASRLDAGRLSVELPELSMDQSYPLEIHLRGTNDPPLVFAVRTTSTL